MVPENLPCQLDQEDHILQIKDFKVDMPGEQVRGISLDVVRGEILGIAGLAGQVKLGIPNGILGIHPASGQVIFNGSDLDLGNTRQVLEKGIAFVSEDRRNVGLLLDESIYWNIGFNSMQIQDKYIKKTGPFKFVDQDSMKESSENYIEDLAIRTTGSDQKARNLSGGNQQKVCLAKAFDLEPDVLFVSEPTRGIDVEAKDLVLRSLREKNIKDQTSIVMVSQN